MFSLHNIFRSYLSSYYFPSLHLSLGLHVSNPVRCQMLPNILLSDAFHLPMPARYTPVLLRLRLTSCMNHYLLYCSLLLFLVCQSLVHFLLTIFLFFLLSSLTFLTVFSLYLQIFSSHFSLLFYLPFCLPFYLQTDAH